jgi:hypothetical protein
MNEDRRIDQLTPAARLALEEYLFDLREEILWRALRSARAYSEGSEIGVRDVTEAANELLNRRSATSGPVSRVTTILRVYALVGVLFAVAGIIVAILPSLRSLDTQTRLGLLAAGSGLTISLFAILLNRQRWTNRAHRLRLGSNEVQGEGNAVNETIATEMVDFLQGYASIELALRNALSVTAGESQSNMPLGKLIYSAREFGLLSESQERAFRRLTDVRNKIAHGRDFLTDDLVAAMRDLEILRSSLAKVV